MKRGQYKTRGRAQLLAHLEATADVPRTAKEICSVLCWGEDGLSTSSVYRMLSELCEAGEVKRHRLPSPAEGYAYQYVGNAHRCESHFHLHCLCCGGVTHLECGCGNEIAAHLAREHGFLPDRGRSVIYGTCAACAGKMDKRVGTV